MIIDAHTHIGFGKAIDARPQSLIASMDRADIDMASVFAGRISQCSTEALLAAIRPYKDRLFAVGAISPLADKPSLRTVEGWLKKGEIRGLKFYPGYEYFYPYDKSVRPYLELLSEYGRPAIFHSGDTFSKVHEAKLKYAHPLHIDEVATELPDLPVIIAHVGYPWVIDAGEVCYKNKNVYVDCSGFVYGQFTAGSRAHFKDIIAQYVRVAGTSERILFGTDWPISDQASYVKTAKEVFGPHAKLVFSGNAKLLFGI